MNTCSKYSPVFPPITNFDNVWNEFYPKLRSLTRRLVYSFHVSSWRGQEKEIIEDILQETACRIIERIQKAEREEARPIHVFEGMIVATAYNYCIDLRRRDLRLVRSTADENSSKVDNVTDDKGEKDLPTLATEQVHQETLFRMLAREIAQFPEKQRRALLVDLAKRMCFEVQATPLQKAFLDEGIRLQDYRQLQPENAQGRSREAALLHHAYKRIKQLDYIRLYAHAA